LLPVHASEPVAPHPEEVLASQTHTTQEDDVTEEPVSTQRESHFTQSPYDGMGRSYTGGEPSPEATPRATQHRFTGVVLGIDGAPTGIVLPGGVPNVRMVQVSLSVPHSIPLTEVIEGAMARSADQRLDPVLVIDERGRMLDVVSVHELALQLADATRPGAETTAEPVLAAHPIDADALGRPPLRPVADDPYA
jgi:hypothetical protein